MFIIRLFLGRCISCCWHFRAGGNCSGTDGYKEAVAEAMQQQGGQINSGACKGHRREEKEAVLVAGCYAAAEVVKVEQYNSRVRSTHTVEEVLVA